MSRVGGGRRGHSWPSPLSVPSRTEGGGRGGANDGHHGPKVNLLRPLSLDLRLRVWAVGNFGVFRASGCKIWAQNFMTEGSNLKLT